jgi:hypothetical protein
MIGVKLEIPNRLSKEQPLLSCTSSSPSNFATEQAVKCSRSRNEQAMQLIQARFPLVERGAVTEHEMLTFLDNCVASSGCG